VDAAVLPGPSMLRLRHDVAARLEGLPGTVIGRDDDRVHVALSPRGSGKPVPLAAVVLLRPSADTIRVVPAPADQALRDLWSLSFNLPTTEDRARCFGALADLVEAVPVLDLFRPLRYDAFDATVAAVAALAQG
jgi:hypothetical protein